MRQNPAGQHLAEFHAPLVETVYAPEAALHRHFVFVQGDQPPEAERIETLEQDGVGRTLPGGDAMRRYGVDVGLRRTLRRHFGADGRLGLADHERFRLREGVGRQSAMGLGTVMIGIGGKNEIHWDNPRTLMHQLDETMLRVGARLAEQHRAGVPLGRHAGQGHALAVALHFDLLKMCRQTPEAIVIGQHALRGAAQRIGVPDAHQGQQNGQVLPQRRVAKMPVHRPGAVQHRLEFVPSGR